VLPSQTLKHPSNTCGLALAPPAKIDIFSELPPILTHVLDGTYARAMQSEQDMTEFVDCLTHAFDNPANMDW